MPPDWYSYLFLFLSVFAIGSRIFKPFIYPVAKPLPILFLINPMFIQWNSFTNYLVYIGLIFGMIGDILLLNGHIKQWFMAGLVAFVIAHLCYAFGFLSDTRFFFEWNQLLPILLFLFLYSYVIASILKKKNKGDWLVPVIFYLWIIAFMVVCAMNFEMVKLGRFSLITLGSFLFFVSDSVLCWDKFLFPHSLPIWLATSLILSTYYTAQFCIAAGTVISHLK